MAYCDKRQLERVFGKNNINQWADLDNDEDSNTIADRVSYMITQAQAEIDGLLEQSPYSTPFAEPPPTIISHACALRAGVMLFNGRRIISTEDPNNQVAAQDKEYQNIMSRIKMDNLRLPVPRVTTQPPKVSGHSNANETNVCDPFRT